MSKSSSITVHTAATLPEEFEFISAIADELADDTRKLVYADWLEEQDDARAMWVRELVTATETLGKTSALPKAGKYLDAWTNMLGLPLYRGIQKFDLVGMKETVLRLARPIVTIKTKPTNEAKLAVGASKFGGHPDLSRDIIWPTFEMGPLGFLGQIALSDVKATQAGRALPGDGLLSFFAYQNYNSGYQPGVGAKDARDTQVLYIPAGSALTRREPPEDLDAEGNAILPSCRLEMCEAWDLPSTEDRVALELQTHLKVFQNGNLRFQLHDCRSECHRYGHHLMGYSLHGRRLDDPSPGIDWVHLLCLESDDNLGWSWCDGQHLAVFVHEAGLMKRRFGRVFGYAS